MKKRRSGEAQAALGRKAGPMRHRLQPRGGSKVDEWQYPEDIYQADISCAMRQPVDSDGADIGGPCLDRCPRPATHRSSNGLVPMCDWHSLYYDKYIGLVYEEDE